MPPPASPISVEAARRIFAYDAAVFGRYARSARALPWREVVRNRGTGHLSIFQTLVHILNVHEVWMHYIVQGRTDELEGLFRRSSRRPTNWQGFEVYSRDVWTGIDSYLATLTAAKLSHRVKAPWIAGKYTAGDAVLQTTLEQAHHLGEIIGLYWQRNRPPPDMTWIDVNRIRNR